MTSATCSLLLALAVAAVCVSGLDNGLARKPPMGWSAWNAFRCDVTCSRGPLHCVHEDMFLDTARMIKHLGLHDAGYDTILLDDCWMSMERDHDGNLVADPKRFPHGIAWLVDQIHAAGLKVGVYGDAGKKTCQGYPGTNPDAKSIARDARYYARNRFDYVKLDVCYVEDITSKQVEAIYVEWSKALNHTGRPMVFECHYPRVHRGPDGVDWHVLAKTCNLWRNRGDGRDAWSFVRGAAEYMPAIYNVTDGITGPGAWHYQDMIVVGGDMDMMTQTEYIAHFAMWCVLRSPLIASTDLSRIDRQSLELLKHPGLISINQDPLGATPHLIDTLGSVQIWARVLAPVSNANRMVLAFFNKGKHAQDTFATFHSIGLPCRVAHVVDVVPQVTIGRVDSLYYARVEPHQARVLLLTCVD